ncbi:MAG: ion transporter [Myxococcota bacterium]
MDFRPSKPAAGHPPLLRQPKRAPFRLSTALHHPATEVVVMVLIVLSIGLLVLEVRRPDSTTIVVASHLITAIFVVELSLRYAVARKRRAFFRRYWADILAVLPLLDALPLGEISVIPHSLTALRFLRLFRLFRLLQLGALLDRRFTTLRTVLRVNFQYLWLLLVFTLMVVLGSALATSELERMEGLQPTQPEFTERWETLWWATYSIVAGEPITAVPQSMGGRLILLALMLLGMGLFAAFTGIISATMIDRLREIAQTAAMDVDELQDHMVLCGWNQGAKPLLAELAINRDFADRPIVLVNERKRQPELRGVGIRPEQIYHVQGDFTQLEVLRAAGIERADRAVVLADDSESHRRGDRDARSVLAALTIERMSPSIYCVVELMDATNKDHLAVAGVEAVIMRNDLSGLALASACRHPRLASVMMDLLTSSAGARLERVPGPVESMSYGQLLARCKVEEGATVLGVETEGGELFINPSANHEVTSTDYLVVVRGYAHMAPPIRPSPKGP